MDFICIGNVFNPNDCDILLESGVETIGFNCDPRDIYFTQFHVIKSIIEKYKKQFHYFFYFNNEQNFVIENLFSRLAESDLYDKEHMTLLVKNKDISDLEALSDYRVTIQVSMNSEVSELMKMDHIESFLIDHDELKDESTNNRMFSFLERMTQQMSVSKKKLMLKIYWGSDLMESLFDFFEIDKLYMMIDQSIEKDVKKVDQQLIQEYLMNYKILFHQG